MKFLSLYSLLIVYFLAFLLKSPFIYAMQNNEKSQLKNIPNELITKVITPYLDQHSSQLLALTNHRYFELIAPLIHGRYPADTLESYQNAAIQSIVRICEEGREIMNTDEMHIFLNSCLSMFSEVIPIPLNNYLFF